MSDEEKKEYEELKSLLYTGTISQYGKRKLIDLIEKQSKEIEDHIENKELINQTLGLEKDANINKTLEKIIILNNYEDKIKAKIEELDKEEKKL